MCLWCTCILQRTDLSIVFQIILMELNVHVAKTGHMYRTIQSLTFTCCLCMVNKSSIVVLAKLLVHVYRDEIVLWYWHECFQCKVVATNLSPVANTIDFEWMFPVCNRRCWLKWVLLLLSLLYCARYVVALLFEYVSFWES